MLGLLVSSELVVQLLSEAWACLSEELEEGEVQLGAFDADTGGREQVLLRNMQGNLLKDHNYSKDMLDQCTGALSTQIPTSTATQLFYNKYRAT